MNLQRQQCRVMSLLIPLSVGLLLISCKKDPTSPPDDRPFITSQDYRKVIVTLIDYDLLKITHQSGPDLKSQNVVHIGIGTKDSALYNQLVLTASTYDPNAQAYIIHYEYSLKLDSSKTVVPLTVRYYLADSSHTDVDTTVLLYKFPYKSAEVFVTDSIMLHPGVFQDIARTDSFFYFLPLGPGGAHQFDLSTHQTRLLLFYAGGNHICAESTFVFFDIGGVAIYRYDLRDNSYARLIPIPSALNYVYGLDIFDGYLYVHSSTPSHYLKRYTFTGVFVDSVTYSPSNSYYMTISDSVVYSVEYVQSNRRSQLNRFDLRTRTFRSNLMAPARWTEGIKIHNDRLYYVDYNKGFVGVVPISDLRSP